MLGWLKDRFRRGPVVPVVRLSGVIASGGLLGSRGLSIESVAPLLKRAFDMRGAKAVALAVNSPGGSPVQSALIGQRIRLLAAENDVKVIAFVEDVAASGGYWLACAADEIIVDPSSIVGSIGVISAGFGFQDMISRIGVERRVHTSGERKAMLDPFLPEKPEDVKRLKAIQKDIHEQFIALVKERRGKRLNGADKSLFSGEFWTAQTALELGLIDGIGDLRSTLRERYGEKVRTPVISAERSFLGRKLGLDINVPGADDLISALEERAYWSRYGL
jgi:signal peptide peptidase SppA